MGWAGPWVTRNFRAPGSPLLTTGFWTKRCRLNLRACLLRPRPEIDELKEQDNEAGNSTQAKILDRVEMEPNIEEQQLNNSTANLLVTTALIPQSGNQPEKNDSNDTTTNNEVNTAQYANIQKHLSKEFEIIDTESNEDYELYDLKQENVTHIYKKTLPKAFGLKSNNSPQQLAPPNGSNKSQGMSTNQIKYTPKNETKPIGQPNLQNTNQNKTQISKPNTTIPAFSSSTNRFNNSFAQNNQFSQNSKLIPQRQPAESKPLSHFHPIIQVGTYLNKTNS